MEGEDVRGACLSCEGGIREFPIGETTQTLCFTDNAVWTRMANCIFKKTERQRRRERVIKKEKIIGCKLHICFTACQLSTSHRETTARQSKNSLLTHTRENTHSSTHKASTIK